VQPTTAPVSVIADTIVRTVELGVTITDAALQGEVTVVFCDLLTTGPGRCPGCGLAGSYRDTVERRVSDVPVAGHPLQLRVRVPRYRCTHDGREREVFCHDTSRLARPGWSTTRRCAQFVLRRLMVDRTTVAAVARELGRSWDTVNSVAMEATRTLLAADTTRLDGVRVIGVDEHRWAHTRHADADGFVTVITDLTAVVDGSGPARLLDLIPRPLRELATLGRALHRRRDDVLAYFTHRASNGPTEAINGRLEALRRNALGFRNLVNYRIRSLLHCGNLAL